MLLLSYKALPNLEGYDRAKISTEIQQDERRNSIFEKEVTTTWNKNGLQGWYSIFSASLTLGISLGSKWGCIFSILAYPC